MLKRGFPKSCTEGNKIKYYSWLRLKEFAEKESSLEKVLGSKEDFLAYLKKVHDYYTYHPTQRESEEIMEFKGPQSFSDASNTKLILIMGKGGSNGTKNPFLKLKLRKFLELLMPQ